MMATDELLNSGAVFAGYEVLRPLGRGGFGAVYEVVKPGATKHVALKVLRAEMAEKPEVVARFIREAKAVALLQHPNIVGAVEVGEHEGHPFLAMELVVGDPLNDVVAREGPLPLERALAVAIPVMAALRTVHAKRIVHRDLKPDNVFITAGDEGVIRPKILDFGFAKMVEAGIQLTGSDTCIGTPNFMSPEQMQRPQSVDPRSDQWAVGVLLYYMLTGVKPFAGKSLRETLTNVLNREPEALRALRPEVPEAVEAIIARALRKKPWERYPSVQAMALALLPFADAALARAHEAEFAGPVDDDTANFDDVQRSTIPPGRISRPYISSEPPEAPSATERLSLEPELRRSHPPRAETPKPTPTPKPREGAEQFGCVPLGTRLLPKKISTHVIVYPNYVETLGMEKFYGFASDQSC